MTNNSEVANYDNTKTYKIVTKDASFDTAKDFFIIFGNVLKGTLLITIGIPVILCAIPAISLFPITFGAIVFSIKEMIENPSSISTTFAPIFGAVAGFFATMTGLSIVGSGLMAGIATTAHEIIDIKKDTKTISDLRNSGINIDNKQSEKIGFFRRYVELKDLNETTENSPLI
jgi:hypothetical protein